MKNLIITMKNLKISILSRLSYLNYKLNPGINNGFYLKDTMGYIKFLRNGTES